MLATNVLANFSKNAFRYDAHAHVQQRKERLVARKTWMMYG